MKMEVDDQPKENGIVSKDTSETEDRAITKDKNGEEPSVPAKSSEAGSESKNEDDSKVENEENVKMNIDGNEEFTITSVESTAKESGNTNGAEDECQSVPSTNIQSPNDDNDNEDDDDFNPLLLCPDISMDVDESPVLTTTVAESEPISVANDMLDSNSLFAPLFSTFVDEMTGAEISFNLTKEEQLLREKLYGPNNPIEYSKVHCTACNVHLGSALAGQTNRFVHPLLKVLICKECYHFYTSGEFEKDEDGSELYCRWCGQGGQVLCCTMCEFVFCKKCIRINFGRKKLTEVRDSDDWKCFRCDMSQLKTLRAMCVEFFEYVRRETARAATLSDPDFMNRDLTNCCQTQIKKRLAEVVDREVEKEVARRPKRRRDEEDPDYNPFDKEKEEDEKSMSPVPSTSGVVANTQVTKQPPIVPKPSVNTTTAINFPGTIPSPTVRIGTTVLNVKSVTTVPQQVTNTATPSFRSHNTAVRSPSSFVSNRPRQTFTPRSSVQAVSPRPTIPPLIATTQNRPITPRLNNNTSTIKHEWFEKTVRAAARVNSNLSYTLTQLNKAQANASSVEQLAVVHNKLQEILSSSINSLIQIRKNLRTEFIAGIKTIRFPPKKPVDPNDDDVIIVNPTPNISNATKTILSGLPHISVKKSTTTRAANSPTTTVVLSSSTTTTASTSSSTPTRGYLKVKSFSQLQTVPSECITIPDDDPPQTTKNDDPIIVRQNLMPEMEKDPLAVDPVPEEESSKKSESEETISASEDSNSNDKIKDVATIDINKINDKCKTVTTELSPNQENSDKSTEKKIEDGHGDKEVENAEGKDKEKEHVDEKKENGGDAPSESVTNQKENEEICDENRETNGCSRDDDTIIENDSARAEGTTTLCNGTPDDQEVVVKKEQEENSESYNVKEKPSPKIRRMLSVKVNLKKTTTVEEMVKQEPVENGSE